MKVPSESVQPKDKRMQRTILSILLLAMLLGGGYLWNKRPSSADAKGAAAPGGRPMGNFPVPVIPGTVEKKDVPIYLDGLGTVQAFNTVTVHTRVDGQVQRVAFSEGQDVHAGDVLAQLDAAPFQAQLDQALARRAQDEAQLAIAKLTLKRNGDLLASKILSQQEYDTQNALVDQLAATINADQAAIDNAKVQLGYATITSPLDGRTGIRLVDQGNIAHANDANGLVVITQLRPISAVFTLPEQNLGQIQKCLLKGETISAFAMDRDNQTVLGEGKLAVVDNQIDITTGTIRLKATFANEDLTLWPGQFINVRLLVATRKGGTVVPASVVQRGPEGAFAFVINNELKAEVRPVKVAQIEQGQALIDEGLVPGEQVVVDGQYKLQPGSLVKLPDSNPAGGKRSGKSGAKGKSGKATH